MPFLTREDGTHFVIPSYRDVLSSKNKSQLKKDIMVLSQSYGEYITLQKKDSQHYEIAFSADTGYLFGETVWQYFKRPNDMVYCEAVPNAKEAMLVVVKDGSVYLDGSFPLESIAEELVIFLSQKNNFDIHIYGDVPISQTPADGKFSFDASSVKSFNVLSEPVFPQLSLIKAYQLQPIEPVLRAHGIGVFPLVPLVVVIAVVAIGWMLWSHHQKVKEEEEAARLAAEQPQINPYQPFYDAFKSPLPGDVLNACLAKVKLFMTMPGWKVAAIQCSPGSATTTAIYLPGGSLDRLFEWAKQNDVDIRISDAGYILTASYHLGQRPEPKTIYSMKDIIITYINRITRISPGSPIPGTPMKIAPLGDSNSPVKQLLIKEMFSDSSPDLVAIIGEVYKDMPFVLQGIAITINENNGSISGTITTQAIGN